MNRALRPAAAVLLACALCADRSRAAGPETTPAASAGLSQQDRDRLAQAKILLQSGDVGGAYAAAKPLFDSYPDISEVQDFRCQLATVRWLDKDALRSECAASVRLAAAAQASPVPTPAPAATAPPPAPSETSISTPAAEVPPLSEPPAAAPEAAEPSASSHDPRYLVVSAGLGVDFASQETSATGMGFYADAEYVWKATSWLLPKAYAGILLNWPNGASCGGDPCDVSARIGFVGGKVRLVAPVPYVAPFVEGGLGVSFGTITTRTPDIDSGSVSFTYHVPVAVGLALGKGQTFDLGLSYLLHPSVGQVDGAYTLGMSFPLP